MTNEHETKSEISDFSDISDISDVSDIFVIDEAFIQYGVGPQVGHITEEIRRQYETSLGTTTPNSTERSLGPIFEYLKTEDSKYVRDVATFDSQSLPERISTLQQAYFSESIENSVLREAINRQEDQLVSRHQDLINAKYTIKHLERDIEALRRQLEELSTERK